MTIEELKELKKVVRAGFYIDDTDGDEEFFRVINQSDEIRILELIDEKISQLSVTDDDVREAIEWLKRIKENALNILDWENDLDLVDGYKTDIKRVEFLLQALQQMRTEGCHSCKGIESHGIKSVKTVTDKLGRDIDAYNTPYNYCPNCGRKLR